jgi:Uma2 family endonuclease
MPAPPVNVIEYLRTPETLLPQELVYGYVREAAAPTPKHQWAVGELFFHLRSHLARHRAGRVYMAPIDVILNEHDRLVVQPDLIVVTNERRHIVTDRVWGAPDIAIEVLSPTLRIGEAGERLDWFARHGVRECWLVNQPVQEIEIVTFAGGRIAGRAQFEADDPIRSAVLPEFALTPGDMLDEG